MMHTVEVDVDLEDYNTEELVEELLSRRLSDHDVKSLMQALELRALVRVLAYAECPPDIIGPLQQWANQPVANLERLQAWKQAIAPGGSPQ